MKCEVCKMEYISGIREDERAHKSYHAAYIIEKHDLQRNRAWMDGCKAWSGRPERESAAAYSTMEESNQRLAGFSVTGLMNAHLELFQSGGGYLVARNWNGDGHDRYGRWFAGDGSEYSYHANWRAGMVHFTEHQGPVVGMVYEGVHLRKHKGAFYFENASMADKSIGRPDYEKQARFAATHKLRKSSSRKNPQWVALLGGKDERPADVSGIKYTNDFAAYGDFALMERVHDHYTLYVKAGHPVYVTQPYDLDLGKYQAIAHLWRSMGYHVDISLLDAWHYPGRTPLVLISKAAIGLTKG